jgi:hypothetical protein
MYEFENDRTFHKIEKVFVAVSIFTVVLMVSWSALVDIVERKDYPIISNHCYKLGEALICKIKQ